MRSGKIRKAYDTITPTPDQKERMFAKIESAMSGEGSRYHARPARENWLPVLCTAMMLVVVIGIGALYMQSLDADPDPLDVVVPTEPSAPDYAGEVNIIEQEMLIQNIKSLYLKAIAEDWDMDACDSAGISRLIAYVTSPDKLGYALMDLDGNGSDELMISDGEVIFDLYSESDGAWIHVFSGGERDSYVLCEENYIRNIASNGAADTVYTFYKLNGADLIWYEKVTYDAGDEDGPWFASHIQVSMTRVAVEEDAALSIIDSYQPIAIQTEPLGAVSVQCVIEEDGVQYLILPISRSKICVKEENKVLLGNVDPDLLKAAEEKLSAQISQYENYSALYLQNIEGQLYLCAEVIVDIDPPTSGEHGVSGCGTDHEHKFFGERITK